MKKAYRHGEVLLLRIEEFPKNLKKLETKIFAGGSHGHDHAINKGILFEDEKEILYLHAKNTSLLHPEHSPNIGDAKIKNGFYKLIKQVEFTPEGLKPVVD